MEEQGNLMAEEQSKLMDVAVEWRGAEALREFLVPIDSLQEYTGNPRRGDVDAIAASLNRFGQVRPIALKGDRKTIVAGHHIVKAAQRLGWDKIAAIPMQFDRERDALAYLLADNRTSELGDYDKAQMVSMIDDLVEAGYEELKGTGFTIDDHETLTAEVGATPTTELVDWQGGYAQGEETAALRAERLAAAQPNHECVLLLNEEENERFRYSVRLLMKEYGGLSMKEAVLRAVETEAARVGPVE